jgi:hypothetical protein
MKPQFLKYCCCGDSGEFISTDMAWAPRVSNIGGITFRINSGKVQFTSWVREKLQCHIKIDNNRKQLAKTCRG